MPAVPYAKILVSVSAGAPTSGKVVCAFGASVQLSGENTTGWASQRWEIYDYPVGFSAPAGWSTDSAGVIFNTAVTPPVFSIGASSNNNWGKFSLRLTVNNNPTRIDGTGAVNSKFNVTLTDTSTILDVRSPKGQEGLGFGESTQGDALRAWAGTVMRNLRIVEPQLGGGGGSTPTGTGFVHVTGGVQDGASALVTNADVDAAAAIAGSKLAANLVITTSVAAGTNPAASGAVRIPYQVYVVSRDAAGTGDFPLISNDNGGFVTTGDASINNGHIFKQAIGGVCYFRFNATDAMQVTRLGLLMNAPILGDSSNSSPFAVQGEIPTIALGSTSRTEVAANYSRKRLQYTGTPGGNCTITMPAPASADQYYEKVIYNNTSGGFSLIMTTGTGATITIANGKQATIGFGSTRTWRVSADIDPTV